MGDRFEYLGAVKPPHHLEIASHADVAYISYVPNNGSINAVFCAPNKVYEFAGFGIPMLCNDNPGLKYTVEYNNMGVCVPELNTENITSALEQIDSNYDTMSRAAISYYDSESVEDAVQRILERYQKLIKDKK
jgi:glycosyltransferase involved in cell wall biosynthesis